MASNEVWGIDIGKSALKAVKMKKIKDQVEITAIDIIEYDQSAEAENVDKEEQVRQALNEFQARNKVKNEKIYVSIPGQATFNRMINIPPVEAKRIKEIVSYEAQQQIPFPINDVLWDYQLIGSAKQNKAEEREVMLFAVRREIINNFLGNISGAKLHVDGIQIAPLALYNFIRYERPELNACVAIDIGAQNTDLVVVDGDKLWLRALPYAGNDITKALQKRFNIPYAEAEKLKLKSGKTKQAKKIFDVMKPVLQDIVGEIHRSVGFYKSMSKEIKFETMIFMGNVTKLADFEQFFSQKLEYQIEILSDLKRIRVSPKINVNLFQTNIPSFAIALGLCIQGLGLSQNKIRLLPEEVRLEKSLAQQKPILALATGLLAIVPAWLWYNNSQLLKAIQTTNSNIDKVLAPISKKEEEWKSVSDNSEYKLKLEQLIKIGANRDLMSTILQKINSVFMDSAEKIKEAKGNKIWILDLEVQKERESYKYTEKDQENIDSIHASIKIAFKTLGDPVLNRDYAIRYLREPLEKIEVALGKDLGKNNKTPEDSEEKEAETKPENRLLFDKKNTTIAIENKDTLFPGDEVRDSLFCHVTLKFISWIDKEYCFSMPDSMKETLERGEIEPLCKIFEQNKCPLSENARFAEKKGEIIWILIDDQNKVQYFIAKDTNNRFKVYQMIVSQK